MLHAEPEALALRLADERAPRLDRIVRRMLAKDREQRFPDLAAVDTELRAILSGATTGGAVQAFGGLPTVAVLPFTNLDGRPEDDWLRAGVAETVSTDFRGLASVEVVPRQRVEEALRRLGDEALGALDDAVAARIARQLGARWVIAGTVQRLGDDVRLTARLLDAPSGVIVRSARLDGAVSTIFHLQDQLVAALAAGLRGAHDAPAAGEETGVVAAYEAPAKGLLNVRSESYEAPDRGILFFTRAVALDPGSSRAHLELGTALSP